MIKQILFFAVLSANLLIIPDRAFAYLDPGTGSLLVQVIIAGFATALVSTKIFWTKIKDFFHSLKRGEKIEK